MAYAAALGGHCHWHCSGDSTVTESRRTKRLSGTPARVSAPAPGRRCENQLRDLGCGGITPESESSYYFEEVAFAAAAARPDGLGLRVGPVTVTET